MGRSKKTPSRLQKEVLHALTPPGAELSVSSPTWGSDNCLLRIQLNGKRKAIPHLTSTSVETLLTRGWIKNISLAGASIINRVSYYSITESGREIAGAYPPETEKEAQAYLWQFLDGKLRRFPIRQETEKMIYLKDGCYLTFPSFQYPNQINKGSVNPARINRTPLAALLEAEQSTQVSLRKVRAAVSVLEDHHTDLLALQALNDEEFSAWVSGQVEDKKEA